MPSDNPTHILKVLDARLDHPVELTLIGKAALWLGFADAPQEFSMTLDVDGVIPTSQSEAFNEDLAFWDALTSANAELESLNLYLTHLFEERQIFLSRDWMMHRINLSRPALEHIRLFRPATLDLILSKMMRGGDDTDLKDIDWMIRHDGITLPMLESSFSNAVIPEDTELLELFTKAKSRVVGLF